MSSLSFTQGFILGQISVCALLFIFIKFFIFGDPPSTPSSGRRRPRAYSSPFVHNPIALSTNFTQPSSSHESRNRKKSVLRPFLPLTTPAILSKTYYNVSNHQPESLDWFNVLVAQTIAQMRVDACQDDAVVSALNAVINGPRKPDFLDEIKVTELNLGEEFPIFSNCRVIPVSDTGTTEDGRPKSSGTGAGERTRLQARMDVDLSDALTLGIETKLVLNYPRPRTAVMPVALAVSVVRFSGTLSISFIPSTAAADQATSDTTNTANQNSADPNKPSSHAPRTHLAFSFSPSYRLELSTHSLLGSRSRLQDVPKIAQIVESRLHDWFDERCVAPRFQQVVLPNIWPRASNTRGGEAADGEAETPRHKRSASRRSMGVSVDSESAIEEDRYEGSDEAAAATGRGFSQRIKESSTSVESSSPQPSIMRSRVAHSRKASGLPQAQMAGYTMPGSLPDT